MQLQSVEHECVIHADLEDVNVIAELDLYVEIVELEIVNVYVVAVIELEK